MSTRWSRTPRWADWVVAAHLAVIAMNLNVTSAGDPLSGLGVAADPATPGITDGGRTTLYGALLVAGAVVAAAGSLPLLNGRRTIAAALVSRTYAGVALAGLLGLLLDYRDGPVRTVHAFVYLMLGLAIVRTVRVFGLLGAGSDPALAAHDLDGPAREARNPRT
ncbi:MAG: hypothetical protein AAGA90_18530 [Actinomycetota bacterium]